MYVMGVLFSAINMTVINGQQNASVHCAHVMKCQHQTRRHNYKLAGDKYAKTTKCRRINNLTLAIFLRVQIMLLVKKLNKTFINAFLGVFFMNEKFVKTTNKQILCR